MWWGEGRETYQQTCSKLYDVNNSVCMCFPNSEPTSSKDGEIALDARLPAFGPRDLCRLPQGARWVALRKCEYAGQSPDCEGEANAQVEGPLAPSGRRSYDPQYEEGDGHLGDRQSHDAQRVLNPGDFGDQLNLRWFQVVEMPPCAI